jgi:outer membrane protein assembly factor BamD (BamD/ComL family)
VTYRNDDVITLTNNIINVKVDAEKDTLLRREYGVAGFPTVVLTKPDGSEIDRIYGYADPETFVSTINDYLNDRNTLADYLRRADSVPTMKLYSMIADKYTGRSNFDKAEEYYNKIMTEDPDNAQGYSDSALISLADMEVRAKRYDKAIASFDSFKSRFPESPMAEDAMFGKAKALRRAKRFDDAIAAFKDFITTYPESDQVETAEIYVAYCNDLKGNKDQALDLYQKFLSDHPDSKDTAWVKKQIDKIENPPAEEKKDEG